MSYEDEIKAIKGYADEHCISRQKVLKIAIKADTKVAELEKKLEAAHEVWKLP